MPAAVSPAAVSPTAIAPPAVAPVVPERPEERDVDSDIRPGDAFGALERHPSLGADRIGHRIANGAESLRNRRRRRQAGLRVGGHLTRRLRWRRAEQDRHAERARGQQRRQDGSIFLTCGQQPLHILTVDASVCEGLAEPRMNGGRGKKRRRGLAYSPAYRKPLTSSIPAAVSTATTKRENGVASLLRAGELTVNIA